MFASRVNCLFDDDSHYIQPYLFDDACMQTRDGVDLFVAGLLTIRVLSRLPGTQAVLLHLFLRGTLAAAMAPSSRHDRVLLADTAGFRPASLPHMPPGGTAPPGSKL